jgi:hypothetical protein
MNTLSLSPSARRAEASVFAPRRWLAIRLLMALVLCGGGCAQHGIERAASPGSGGARDVAFLDDLQRRAMRFFVDHSDAQTGLVADRARTDGRPVHRVSSIAATGFGLTAWCIGDQRGWIDRPQVRQRVLTTLRFLHDDFPHERGFFYHFVDMRTGQRQWTCELSSIDTALLMAGVLTARQYFADDPVAGAEIQRLGRAIYDRVDWPWMLAGGQTLSMGWTPERGFIASRWDNFSEHPILYLMAMGSQTHPLPAEAWQAWRREPVITYAGRTFLQSPPLFVHQFPHAWIDFRGRRDAQLDHWRNSVDATLAQRQFCNDLASRDPARFGHYGPNLWGITASDSVRGYRIWGGPPATSDLDGTVVPCAAAGSLPFAPRQCLAALRHMRAAYPQAWGRYGFADAFNPATGWVNPDVIGIDLGITLLMAENLRSGMVWEYFMRNDEIQRGLKAGGFRSAEPAGKRRRALPPAASPRRLQPASVR